MNWGKYASHARMRFDDLSADAPAAVVDLLMALAGDDSDPGRAALCRWAADADPAAALREQWARELVTRAREVAAPVLVWHDARQAGLLEWQNAAVAALRAGLPEPPRHVLGLPATVTADPAALEAGLPVAVAVVLAALKPDTRASVRAKIDAGEGWGAAGAGPGGPWGSAWAWLGGYGGPVPNDQPVPDGWHTVCLWEFRVGPLVALDRQDRPVEPPRYLRALGLDLWFERWGEEARRLYALAPALLIPVHRDIGHALRAVGQPPEEGEQLRLPGLVAVMPEGAETLARALRAAEEVSPMLAQRVMRSLVAWGAAAWACEGRPVQLVSGITGQRTAGDSVELVIEGGLETLRVAVGSTKKGDRVADVLSIFASHGARWQHPGARGAAPLLLWKEVQRETAGRRAVAVVTLGPLLLPGLAAEAGVPVADRVLVPALPVPPMPSKCWPGWAGPLAAMDWFALERLALERAELAAEGGVALRWTLLAREAGASDRALGVALELWQTCGRYREVSAGRWALGDGAEEQRAHALLMDGAGRSQRAREAGRRSVARRTGPRE
jgi:hypothetical protein